MFKKIFYFNFFIIFSCSGSTKDEVKWDKFTPYYIEENKYYIDTIAEKSENRNRSLVNTIMYYNIDIKVESGTIYIPSGFSTDTNLMYNIWIKSGDSVWMEQHLKLLPR